MEGDKMRVNEKGRICVHDLSKSYNGIAVLKNYNLELEPGSRTIIMAPSGYGKTTLLRLMMGLEQADSGEIIGVPEKKSAVFQENRLCEGFSAIKNVEMIDRYPGCPDVRTLLTEIGLGSSLDKSVRTLSGGMQRRCAIVRAMAADSDIVFLDEPFQGLDKENYHLTAAFIKKYLNGRMLVVVSHNEEDAELLGADICRM